MESKSAIMQELFRELSEPNKDIMILIAKSINIAQENPKQPYASPKKTSRMAAVT